MRSLEIPNSKAKLKLLAAAEQKVAQKGFDAVSVRDITQLAKANVAAVNYHFGSRETLLAWVMIRRMNPIHQDQLDRLTVLEKKRGSKPVPLEELLEAYFRPLVLQTGVDEANFRSLWPVVARIMVLPLEELPQELANLLSELWKRYLKAFSKTLSSIERNEVAWRLHLLNGAAARLLSPEPGLYALAGISAQEETAEQLLARLLRLAIPAMRDGVAPTEDPQAKKGPQATFDF